MPAIFRLLPIAINLQDALTAAPLTLSAPVQGAPALTQKHTAVAASLTTGAPVRGPVTLAVKAHLTTLGLDLAEPDVGTSGNLLVNGRFDDGGSGWTLEPVKVTVSNGRANAVGGGRMVAQGPGVLVVGRKYVIRLDMNMTTGVGVRIGAGDINGSLPVAGGTLSVGLGSYSFSYTASGTYVAVEASGQIYTGSIDNVSVKEWVVAFTQKHALAFVGLTVGAPVRGSPALGGRHTLAALGIAAGSPVLGPPVLKQAHVLTSTVRALNPPIISPNETGTYTPAEEFEGGAAGLWLDPSDFSTMWQDLGGTIPVTSVGQSVGRIADKSGNANYMTAYADASRPVLGSMDGKAYLDFDGVDDLLVGTIPAATMGGNISKRAVVAFRNGWPGRGDVFRYGALTDLKCFALDNRPGYYVLYQWSGDLWAYTDTSSELIITAVKDLNFLSVRFASKPTEPPIDRGTTTLDDPTFMLGARAFGSFRGHLKGRIYGLVFASGEWNPINAERWLASKSGAAAPLAIIVFDHLAAAVGITVGAPTWGAPTLSPVFGPPGPGRVTEADPFVANTVRVTEAYRRVG